MVETRASELALMSVGVRHRLAAMPEALVAEAAPGAAIVILTHDHALDFLIAREALARDDLAYVGMIGSKTKRATFASQARESGLAQARIDRLVLPIGGRQVPDKRPAVIAAMTAESWWRSAAIAARAPRRSAGRDHRESQDRA